MIMSHLPPIILCLALIAWSLAPLLPMMVKGLIEFPRLEGTTRLKGTFEYEGEWPQVRLPRYFVVDTAGRHEFYCGYLGARHTCFTRPDVFRGQEIQVWSTYWYGSIQHHVAPKPGQRPYPTDISDWTYAASRALYLDPRYSRPRGINYFGLILLGGYCIWLAVNAAWRRNRA